MWCPHASDDRYTIPHAQAFLTDILEDDDFLNKRRKLLRQRAGLTSKDKKLVLASILGPAFPGMTYCVRVFAVWIVWTHACRFSVPCGKGIQSTYPKSSTYLCAHACSCRVDLLRRQSSSSSSLTRIMLDRERPASNHATTLLP